MGREGGREGRGSEGSEGGAEERRGGGKQGWEIEGEVMEGERLGGREVE